MNTLRLNFPIGQLLLPITLACICICLCVCTPTYAVQDEAALQQWKSSFDQNILPIIKDRCLDCHDGPDADGGFDLGQFKDGNAAAEKSGVWETVGKKIRLNEMPPEGSPQLNDPQKGKFYAWLDSQPQNDLCSKLATDETQAWYKGVVMSRRLTRTEYLNAIQQTVGLQVEPQFNVPSDGAGGEGFDTNGDSLFTSPIHIEQYLAIADNLINRLLSDQVDSDLDSDQQLKQAQLQLLTPSGLDSLPKLAQTLSKLDQAKQIEVVSPIIKRFAWLAWRRPVDANELQGLIALYQQGLSQEGSAPGSANGSPVAALGLPLKACLISPKFLFVVEPETEKGGIQKLTQHQLATRLALFLWSSGPDQELLEQADRGELETDQQVITATRRMLQDPKAIALGKNFGLQWLSLSNFLATSKPDAAHFPEYNGELANDLQHEAVATIARIFQEDRSIRELVSADWIMVNQRLANHYGLPWPENTTATWEPIPVGDSQRGGVVTLGATLVSTSYPSRTSPVLRGRWLLEELLGSRVPPPPAGVPALEESTANHAATLRERLEEHRKNPECASCHNRMDPLGFGLENFDALGRWRDQDQGSTIDATGKLPSGDQFNGPQELKEIVLRRGNDFDRHLTRKLLGFALGRSLNKFDDCVVDDSLKKLQANEYRASNIVETIVTSYPFQHRYFKAEQSQNE